MGIRNQSSNSDRMEAWQCVGQLERLASRLNIMLDMDGVLCDYTKGVFDLARSLHGDHIPPLTTRTQEEWTLMPQMKAEEYYLTLSRINDVTYPFWQQLEPLWDCLPRLKDLAAEFNLYFVTNRPRWTEIQTKRWIEKHTGIRLPRVIVVDHPEEKVTIAQLLGYVMVLEDRVETVRLFDDLCPDAFCSLLQWKYNTTEIKDYNLQGLVTPSLDQWLNVTCEHAIKAYYGGG